MPAIKEISDSPFMCGNPWIIMERLKQEEAKKNENEDEDEDEDEGFISINSSIF